MLFSNGEHLLKFSKIRNSVNMSMTINSKNVNHYMKYREQEKVYIELNRNMPSFTTNEIERGLKEPFEEFSDLNSGCYGTAFACISYESLMSINNQRPNKTVNPSGWRIEECKYVDGGQLYNRCHLIACQLTNYKNDGRNLITGTNYFNMEGMRPFEKIVSNYVSKEGRKILYRVIPFFEGDNSIAYGVQMEALPIDNMGTVDGLPYNVFVYNMQPGIIIHYEDGKSEEDGSWGELEKRLSKEYDCLCNANTNKFHVCSSDCEEQMNLKHCYLGISKELIKLGYSPCKNCYPNGIK